MEFEGKVIMELPVVEGVGKATGKAWKKKEWVLETLGNYPRKVKVQAFNDRADSLNLQVGQIYVVSVDAESREFNGRWYTDLSVFAARESQPQGAAMPQSMGAAPVGGPQFAAPGNFGPVPQMPAASQEDDLPF